VVTLNEFDCIDKIDFYFHSENLLALISCSLRKTDVKSSDVNVVNKYMCILCYCRPCSA